MLLNRMIQPFIDQTLAFLHSKHPQKDILKAYCPIFAPIKTHQCASGHLQALNEILTQDVLSTENSLY